MAPEEIAIQKSMMESEYFMKRLQSLINRKSIVVCLLRVWLAIFLAAQNNGDVSWDWGLVLLPVWSYFLVEVILHNYLATNNRIFILFILLFVGNRYCIRSL